MAVPSASGQAGGVSMDRVILIEKMIGYAKSLLGSTEYWLMCLAFIEDALEQSNGIEIFGGDSARESYELYKDALSDGVPERGAFVFYDCLCQTPDGLMDYGHCGIALDGGEIIHAWDRVRIDDYRVVEQLRAGGHSPRYLGWVPIERVLKQKP